MCARACACVCVYVHVVSRPLMAAVFSAPFTLQRFCELILDPKRFYRNTNKFFQAMSKVRPASAVCGAWCEQRLHSSSLWTRPRCRWYMASVYPMRLY